jgi:hypothetical protein
LASACPKLPSMTIFGMSLLAVTIKKKRSEM